MIIRHRRKTTQTNYSNPVDNRIAYYKKLVYLRNELILMLFRNKHKKLYEETINTIGINDDSRKINLIVKRIETLMPRYEGEPSLLFLFLWKCLDLFNRPIYEICNNLEQEQKQREFRQLIIENRGNKIVFYLCSKHNDCAKDHLDYQGKIYVDENWREIDDRVEIMNYIDKHRIETIQNVVNEKPYLIRRPYCRHYFRGIETKELLDNSVEYLLQKYLMIKAVGEHSNSDVRIFNANNRLELLKAMYKYKKLPIIEKYILHYQKLCYNEITQSIGG